MILTMRSQSTLQLLSCSVCFLLAGANLSANWSRPEWEDERVNSIDNETARASSVPSASLAQALEVPYADESDEYVQSLNGAWKFNWVPKPEERPVDFYQPSFDVSDWAEIPVPSNMEIEGYGPPIYISAGYAFKVSYPEPIVTAEPPKHFTAYKQRNPVGSYRRDFTVSEDWKGREVYLHFAGGGAAYYVWINGERVGYFEDTFSPSEFRVTDHVKYGEPNVLAVEVYRWADGSYLEDQDFFRLSGLYRDVFLWSSDPVHVRDFFVTTDLDAAYEDATLNSDVTVRNLSEADRELVLQVSLFDAEGERISQSKRSIDVVAGDESVIQLSQSIEAPAKWSAESPYLYTTVIELIETTDGREVTIDRRSCKTGFREVEINDKKQFLVNGKPVILKGANRHGHDPETGHYERMELMLADVLLMKRNNVNCVRTAHYPNDPKFYDLLDEYGIYAIDEANIESHGLLGMKDKSVSYDPKWEQAYLDRALTMVQRDKNHPSIVIWSMGNEGGGGQNYVRCAEETRKIDDTRIVFYDNFHDGYVSDMDGSMYLPLQQMISQYGEPELTHPYFHTEFAHSQGNAMGNMQEYVDAFEKYDQLVGGAIWDWVDQAIWVEREDGSRYLGYGGSWGETPNANRYGVNGVIFADRSQADKSSKLAEVRKAYQPVKFTANDLKYGTVTIENLNDFTNLSEFELVWTLSEEGTVIESGVLEDFELAPAATQTVEIPWSVDQPNADREYWLRVSVRLKQATSWADAGYDLAWEQFLLPTEAQSLADLSTIGDSSASLKVKSSGSDVQITGKGFSLTFDQDTGLLKSLQQGSAVVFKQDGGEFHASRALTDNDFLMFDREWFREKYWAVEYPDAPQQKTLHLDSLTRSLQSFKVTEKGTDKVQIVVQHAYKTQVDPWKFDVTTTWEIFPNGVILSRNQVETNLPAPNRKYITSLGFNYVLSGQYDQFTWYGAGPLENYPDRRRSADVSVYSASVDEMFVPYPKSQDFGNREGVRWLSLTNGSGKGVLIMADESLSASAKHYSKKALSSGKNTNIADVAKSEDVHLDLNFAQLGVGNGSCGECPPLEAYLSDVDASENFVYAIVLLESSDHASLADIGRRSIEPIQK